MCACCTGKRATDKLHLNGNEIMKVNSTFSKHFFADGST